MPPNRAIIILRYMMSLLSGAVAGNRFSTAEIPCKRVPTALAGRRVRSIREFRPNNIA